MHLAPPSSAIMFREDARMNRQITLRVLAIALLTVSAAGAAGCNQHRHEGPAQAAGRHIDHGLDKAGDAVEGAGRKVNRALPGD
jgi:hypothetical protein